MSRFAPWERRAWGAVPALVLLLLALILRAPVTVMPPLLPELEESLHLGTVQLALLTSIPVLCFGVLTPAASALVHLIGVNHAVLYGLTAVVLGSLWRANSTTTGLFGGTLTIGAGLTIGNIAVPMIISRQYRDRSALLTGTCSAVTNVAVTGATALAVPIALVVGWQRSSALWGAVLGAVALVLWLVVYPPGIRGARPALRRRAGSESSLQTVRQGRTELRATGRSPIARWRVAWLLAAAFAGHTLAYYAVTSWLPLALTDLRHMDPGQAGAAAAVFQVAGIAGPLLVPWLVDARSWSTTRCTVAVSTGWALLPLGLVLAPAAWPVWTVAGGAAQGAFFTLLFMIVVRRTRTVDESRRLAALVQTVGYSAAATGPVLMGWVHQNVADWGAAFLVVLAAVVAMTASLLAAVRDTSEPPPVRRAGPTPA